MVVEPFPYSNLFNYVSGHVLYHPGKVTTILLIRITGQ